MSYLIARALAVVDYPISHVYDVAEFEQYRTPILGQCRAPDELIAEYCGTNEIVLVSIDSEFRGKWVRSGVLRKENVEVIVYPDLIGLRTQVERVVLCYPHWQAALTQRPYGFRVWTYGKQANQRVPVLDTRASKTG